MTKVKKRLWEFPWQYKESLIFVWGFISIGFILQLTVGKFDFNLIQFPVNLIIGLGIILLLGLFSTQRKSSFYIWFSGVHFSVCLITSLMILGIIMGLTPQLTNTGAGDDLLTLLGLRQMTTSWPFIICYTLTLLALGALIIRRIIQFNLKDYAFYLNHIGLWILLFSAGMGAADLKRYVMYVEIDNTEWRVYNDNKDVLELPIAIQLNSFDIEQYPPKLAVINRQDGMPQPIDKPDYFQIDEKRPEGELYGWDIKLEKYIHDAVRNSDSTYHEVHMPGSTPAAYINAINKKTGQIQKGWVCGGNMAQLYMTLNLDSTHCIVMTQPEPKRFVSDINVFTEDGEEKHCLLEVNKPLRVGSWTIYQYGYDNEAGKMSTYSSMELVYDPWLYFVYAGIILLGLGSVCLLWSGNSKKKKEYDVE